MELAELEAIKANEASIKILKAADFEDRPLRVLRQKVVQIVVALIEVVNIAKHYLHDYQIIMDAVNNRHHMLRRRCLGPLIDHKHQVMCSNFHLTLCSLPMELQSKEPLALLSMHQLVDRPCRELLRKVWRVFGNLAL